MLKAIVVRLTIPFLFSMPVLADQVVLKNGDRLTGGIVSADEKELTIKTEFAGTIKIQADAIVQISSDQPLYLVLKDSQTLLGIVSTTDDRLDVRTADAGSVSVSRASLQTIRSKEAQSAYEAELDRLRNPGLADLWKGTADAGFSLTRGNSKTVNLSLGMNATRTTTRDKTTAYVTSLYATNRATGANVNTANAVRGGGRYDLNITSRLFGYGTGDLEYDEFQKLDLRVVLGGGLGWKVYRHEDTVFSVFGGGTLNKEYFSTGLKRSSGEIMMGEELTYSISKSNALHQRAAFMPNMTDIGEYRFTFDVSNVMNLNSWLGWNITFSDRYLSNPVAGTEANDVLLTTGLRVSFGQ
jgi:putative salt-induced outer membrane protein YdiY